jgi:hypothetical protein
MEVDSFRRERPRSTFHKPPPSPSPPPPQQHLTMADEDAATQARIAKEARIAALSDDEIIEALRTSDLYMFDIPDARLAASPDLCFACVELNGSNLRSIPYSIRTAAFDRRAAMSCTWAFGYLHEADKTEKLLLDVIRDGKIDHAMLGEEWAVPERLLTAAVAAAARKEFGEAKVDRYFRR